MPTQPISAVIDREYAICNNKKNHDNASTLLQEIVNYSSHIFHACLDSSTKTNKYKENVKLAPFCLYCHAIEMVDAAEVLISNSCVPAVIPLLRSQFETYLSLKFMLQKHFERRSLAWFINSKTDLQKFHRLFDDNTEEGRRFSAIFVDTVHFSGEEYQKYKSKILVSISNTNQFLARPEIKPIADEVKRKGKWYSIDDGPHSIKELAERVGLGVHYKILYGQWSAYSHSTDPNRFIRAISINSKYHSFLRIDDELSQLINFLVSYQLEMSRLLINEFNPTVDISQWYVSEVGDLFRSFFSRH